MKYMLLVYGAENSWTDDERKECMVESMGICEELAKQGKYITASPLQYVATAATVRVRQGNRMITDGPFAETTEQLGGYYILDVENLDEAINIACRIPPAKKGTVEIRPIYPVDGLPKDQFTRASADDGTNTKFMFLCYDDEEAWRKAGSESHRKALQEAVALTHRLDATGKYVTASPLHPVATATSIRVRNGQRIITDGPFAETREVLGGYYVIFAKDQEEALQIAAQHPGVFVGAVEVRPVFDLAEVQDSKKSKKAVEYASA